MGRRPEPARQFVMPVDEDVAAMGFFTEAVRTFSSQVEGLRDDMRQDRQSRREESDLLHSIDKRLFGMEEREKSRNDDIKEVKDTLKEMGEAVQDLKDDKMQREGAAKLRQWTVQHLPSIVAVIIAILASLIVWTVRIYRDVN